MPRLIKAISGALASSAIQVEVDRGQACGRAAPHRARQVRSELGQPLHPLQRQARAARAVRPAACRRRTVRCARAPRPRRPRCSAVRRASRRAARRRRVRPCAWPRRTPGLPRPPAVRPSATSVGGASSRVHGNSTRRHARGHGGRAASQIGRAHALLEALGRRQHHRQARRRGRCRACRRRCGNSAAPRPARRTGLRPTRRCSGRSRGCGAWSSSASSTYVSTSSWPLRSGVRSPDRNRFLASCCVMVEPPTTLALAGTIGLSGARRAARSLRRSATLLGALVALPGALHRLPVDAAVFDEAAVLAGDHRPLQRCAHPGVVDPLLRPRRRGPARTAGATARCAGRSSSAESITAISAMRPTKYSCSASEADDDQATPTAPDGAARRLISPLLLERSSPGPRRA